MAVPLYILFDSICCWIFILKCLSQEIAIQAQLIIAQ